MRRIIPILFLFLVNFSCGYKSSDSITFDHLEPWDFSDVLKGNLKNNFDENPVNFKVDVNYDADYQYENLYIKLLLLKGKDTLAYLVKSIPLQNDLGQWEGAKSGNGYELAYNLLDSINSNQRGIDFEITQYSRENSLSGINSLKVSLEKF